METLIIWSVVAVIVGIFYLLEKTRQERQEAGRKKLNEVYGMNIDKNGVERNLNVETDLRTRKPNNQHSAAEEAYKRLEGSGMIQLPEDMPDHVSEEVETHHK